MRFEYDIKTYRHMGYVENSVSSVCLQCEVFTSFIDPTQTVQRSLETDMTGTYPVMGNAKPVL